MPVNNTNKSDLCCVVACVSKVGPAMSQEKRKVNNMSSETEQTNANKLADKQFAEKRDLLTKRVRDAMFAETICRNEMNTALREMRAKERLTKLAGEDLANHLQKQLPL